MTLDHVGVDGSSLLYPPTPYWSGISFVDTSGTIESSSVANMTNMTCSGCSSVVGVQVESNTANSTVTVQNNTVGPKAGLAAVSAMTGGVSGAGLSAIITGNTITGDIQTDLSGTSEVGIAAGGLSSLDVEGNTISDFQAPWNEAALWVDSLAAAARCTIGSTTANMLSADDNGVALAGASGCTISGNTISAGVTGVEIGQGFPANGSAVDQVASNNNAVSGNTITAVATEATGSVYCSYSPASGPCAGHSGSQVATSPGLPLDGILDWDGTSETSAGLNTISGFLQDLYLGQDPNFFADTTLEGFGLPQSYSGFNTTATITGADTFPDGSTVEAGTLTVENSGALGIGTVTDDNGGTLGLNNNGGSALSVGNPVDLGDNTSGTALLVDQTAGDSLSGGGA